VSRTVTLVLVDPGGAPLGTLAPFAVDLPWWQEVAEVVAGARERYGLDVTVLRLLAADRPRPHGGAVTYLAECAGPVPAGLAPVAAGLDLAPHPLRAAWAYPGGPAASLRWATDALAGLGYPPVVAASQRRTWNLSSIWRLDGAWLKEVPPFLAHEAAVLRWLGAVAPARIPVLLAAGDGRMLNADIPGGDRYDAGAGEAVAMLADLHGIQVTAARHTDTLVALGVPDRRGPRLVADVAAVARRWGAGIAGLDDLVAGLPDRLAAVAACGLPDTLVHGDFHPGNVRADGSARVILDWGDSFVGNPAFDALRMAGWLPEPAAAGAVEAWAAAWRSTVPGSDPEETLRLLRPVGALRGAAGYAAFVAGIEPTERPYHDSDIGDCLRHAVELGAPSVSAVA
jgi:hypothetical protein